MTGRNRKSYRNPDKVNSKNPHGASGPVPVRKDESFWEPFEKYNVLEPPLRSDALKELGILETDPEVIGILTKSHFVIPGKTRFECQRCGECCRYSRNIAPLTYEPCLYLGPENTCTKHDSRYLVCKWFPFFVYESSRYGPLLTIKPFCSGFGKGPLVDYSATTRRLRNLERSLVLQDDGAYVIHEVVYIPGWHDWVFPSKTNVDALMKFIQIQNGYQPKDASSQDQLDHTGEVQYAHHGTSGLIGRIGDPLLTISRTGIITDVNAAACDVCKKNREELTGLPFPQLFVNPERITAFINTCFSRGKEIGSAQRLRLPGDATDTLVVNGIVFRDRSDGFVHSALVCLNPVPKSVFCELSQSRTYARGLIEASLDALFFIDIDGILTDVNESVVRLTGQNRESLTGSPFRNLFSDPEKAQLGVERTLREDRVRNYELALLDGKGATIPVSFNATLYRDPDGVTQGVFAAARDIRERLRMIHDLEEAKNYARGLIDSSLDLMVTIDREGIIRDVNNAAVSLTGMARNRLIGSRFSDFFEDQLKAEAGVKTTFADGEVRNYRLNLKNTSGHVLPVSFNANLYRDSGGVIQGIFAIARTLESA